MKQIHEKVNLIPVIAKADTLTKDETVLFKKRVSMSRSREGGGGGGNKNKNFSLFPCRFWTTWPTTASRRSL